MRTHWFQAPCWYRVAPLALGSMVFAGCQAHHEPITGVAANKQMNVYPARPAITPPTFKMFHHDASSVTLVTKEDASDEQVESLIWELRDAARAHSFDKLSVPQTMVDARDPIVWFHIYRGAKCASEKYASGKLPCGASYHVAGEYTLGGFKDKDHDDGALIKDEEHEVHLWP